MQRRVARARRAGFPLLLLTLISTVHAESFTYGIDAGVGESDNVTLVHDNKVNQTIAVTDFDLDYKKKSQRLDVDAKGSFSYLDYLQHAYGSHLFGRFDGIADVALIPQRLTWAVQEDFGQSAINPFTPSTPTNLENINYLATGPDLYLRLGGASFLDVSARVARAQYQTTPFTNTRAMGSVAWGLNLSALSSISVNGDTQRVRFQNTLVNTNFERTHVFGRYELEGARTKVSADIGATVVGQNGESKTGGLVTFSLARKLSAAARLTVTLGHDNTDGSTSFSGLQGGASGVVGTAPATNTSETYTRNYGSVGWDYQRNRTTLGLSGRWEKDTYAGQAALDRTMTTGELRVQRLMTQAFTLQVLGLLYKSDYANAAGIAANGSPSTTTGTVGAAVIWRHGRALEVKLTGEHTTYTTSPNDTGYRDNRLFLTVGYRPLKEAQISETAPGT